MWLLIVGAALVAAVLFAFVLPRFGGGEFTIQSEDFAADTACTGTGTYAVDPEGNTTSVGDVEITMVEDGMPTPWCVGLTHRYTSVFSYAGYTFTSDPDDPLEFVVEEDGFTYAGGSGTVETPEGETVELP